MDSRTAKRQLQQEGKYNNPNPNANFKILLLAMVLIGALYWVMDKETPTSTYQSTSNQFCTIHSTTYSPNNAYGGCPKCVKNEQARKAGEGLEKKIYGRKRDY